MSDNESKGFLKQAQVWVAILAGLVTFIVGAYNTKNIFFSKKEPEVVVPEKPKPDPIRSSIEEVGATWIKKMGMPKTQSPEVTPTP